LAPFACPGADFTSVAPSYVTSPLGCSLTAGRIKPGVVKCLPAGHANRFGTVDTEHMRIHLTGPRVIDLDQRTVREVDLADCCDLCRAKAPLYRLLQSTDALCERCFGMWHG
jgi:hypothetical protein